VIRTLVAWCPDWPVIAAAADAGLDPDRPIAVIEKSLVFACSPAARAEGVTRGMRARAAQARCTDLVLLDYDRGTDARVFEPVVQGVEASMAGVQLVRPGMLAMKARGPARYYGGELPAARLLTGRLAELGVPGARIGIADGPFAAEHAARHAQSVLIIPAGESPAFLGRLPIAALGDANLVSLLGRLGIHPRADFAALPPTSVRERFGSAGALAHALAAGLDATAITPRTPPRDLRLSVDFEPPLDRIDQVTFGIRAAADRFIDELLADRLACTEIRVAIHDDSASSERTWLHPRWFTGADVVDRVRWQLQGSGSAGSGLRSAITRVVIEPEAVDPVGSHEAGLWGNGPDEGVHHGLSRVQGMLGHEGVVTPVLGGGRLLVERQVLVAWGDRPSATLAKEKAKPWPGSLPEPAPATVFPQRRAVVVLGSQREELSVSDRGVLSGHPAFFSPTGKREDLRRVEAWAGPWPLSERWWDAASARNANRFQLIDASATAWLLVLEGREWWAEGMYD
jgi:protein ImuB